MSKNKQKQHGTDKAQNQQPQSQNQHSDDKDSKSEPQGAKNQQKNK